MSPPASRLDAPRSLVVVLALLAPMAALAQAPLSAPEAQATPVSSLATDETLSKLLTEALEARPELRQVEAQEKAAQERVPQAGALPDPVLQVGIQNDGFGELMIGEMEGSYFSIMASQALPFPGKRDLRTQVARLGAKAVSAQVLRARLTIEAELRRAYLDLLMTRERRGLLDRLEAIWKQSADLARIRYETGDGAQSDLLRAQLELNRIRQRRVALNAEERTRVQTLNRLSGRPLDEPLPTTTRVRDLGIPELGEGEAAEKDAMERSPELAEGRANIAQSQQQMALARRERWPDFTVSAGVMPRGGDFPTMWQANVGVNLPIFSGSKQNRAVAESVAMADAATRATETVEQVLRLRVRERLTALSALRETATLYRSGLLMQSAATAESTLTQYRVGRASFASVLEANSGIVRDEEDFLSTLVEAQRLAIAQAEVSLEPVAALGGGSAGAGGMPGAGSAPSAPARGAALSGGAAGAAPSSASSSMSGM
ncbi:cation efflux system protein CusC [Myxococcus stipitatus DSM 14675]|uniref:Cation efflux system protein CusC n=1 Tax=Myxococcus stipitatus (strain DSM 14675 / JCM 12634 / Mx s8) TaxID=1278073 RepID=L7UBA5_MYXSD|nr:TolC family protein [Myxococcus stipitatus]AGC46181.1 cation efflux system protein CusC [Myxococcus stipitatus DSM 14675]